MLVWPKFVCPQKVVMECAGSGVGAQLLDPGLSELCHPGDFFAGTAKSFRKNETVWEIRSPWVAWTYVLGQR